MSVVSPKGLQGEELQTGEERPRRQLLPQRPAHLGSQ
jgi:hypothetical protein